MQTHDDRLDGGADILIVEDSETQANQLAHLLSSSGYNVRVARNGRLALEAAREAKPTLVVSDIAMPEMDGFTMCRQFKQDPAFSDVPVILLTALTTVYDVIKGLDCGADNFIRKPFERKYLLGRIRFILANRALRSNERVQLGMQINLGGQTHFVTAERQQIFDLLVSTYEEAIQMTEELRAQQTRIAHSYQALEGLYKIAEALNPAITEKAVSEMALDRALDLPGVTGGCVRLLGSDGSFYTAATRDFGPDDNADTLCPNCLCRNKLIDGSLRTPEVIRECAVLAQAGSSEAESSGHVSIPLTVGERTLGVMNLLSTEATVLNPEDYQLLDTVGNQIAIALERANLYTHMETLVNERTEALRAERNRLSAVVNTTGALVILVDSNGRIAEFNPASERSLGWKADEVKNRFFWEIFLGPEEATRMRAVFHNLRHEALSYQTQQEWRTRDGETRNIIWSTSVLKKADGSIEYLLGTGLDVTELRLAEGRVQYLSNFDVITGLPNRFLLRDRVKLVSQRVIASNKIMGFLIIHFTRLTLIRESLGAKAEHALLLQMTNRLSTWAGNEDSVARFGDDMFGVVAVRPDTKDLATVARQLVALFNQPLNFEQQELHLEAHIGIATFPNDGDDFDTLSQAAEAAMRRALASKTERYEFYRPELNRSANERLQLEIALRRALETNQFQLHYQPQIDLQSRKIIGLEALVRWQHPELGLIPPGRFIGLAEDTGLILPLGEWVLRTACAQNRAWQKAGLPVVPVAVNLSAKQFSKDILESVRNILAETGLAPELLELELTETVSMEAPETTIEILHTLKEMGVALAIDDFGTGYSNLSYLKRFPVDKLKLDRSFVQDLNSDPNDLSIARAIIAMAHSLRLKVIAEGVETQGQFAVLAQNSCDEMQGYFYSRPVDAVACEKILRDGAAHGWNTTSVKTG